MFRGRQAILRGRQKRQGKANKRQLTLDYRLGEVHNLELRIYRQNPRERQKKAKPQGEALQQMPSATGRSWIQSCKTKSILWFFHWYFILNHRRAHIKVEKANIVSFELKWFLFLNKIIDITSSGSKIHCCIHFLAQILRWTSSLGWWLTSKLYEVLNSSII